MAWLPPIGAGVGVGVGRGVGVGVGAGRCVGVGVGATVGAGVGVAVGAGVGVVPTVGFGVAAGVGVMPAVAVAVAVGVSVGAGVPVELAAGALLPQAASSSMVLSASRKGHRCIRVMRVLVCLNIVFFTPNMLYDMLRVFRTCGVYPQKTTRCGYRSMPAEEGSVFIIPEKFASFMIELAGEEGRAWLERLPAILAACEERWDLKIQAPVANLSFNYVAPARLADGTEVMLKAGLTDEFPSQPLALQHFAGHGMVRLLAYDEHDKVMLMERLKPGRSLRAVESDEAAVSTTAAVMRKIWRPLPQEHYPFPTVEDWGKGFTRIRKMYDGGTGPIPSELFDRGEKLYAELCASMAEPVLLHGDLHQDNILSAEREPWLAVDPKGVIGEPAYETGSLLRNFWPDILAIPDPKALTRRRIDQLSAELGFERARVHGWAFSQAVLSVLWTLEDTGKLEADGLYFVELLAAG